MIKAAIFDLDGTIYRKTELVPGADRLIQTLRENGIALRFYTNRATRSPDQVAEKLTALLQLPISPDEVITSAEVTASQLVGQTVFCVGEPALHSALSNAGIRLTNGSDEQPNAVVVGLTYQLDLSPQGNIGRAIRYIQQGAQFIATNPDKYVLEDGLHAPTCGAVTAPIETVTQIKPQVYGKPHPAGAELALRQMGVGPSECIFVGDNLNTDIPCAHAAGIKSVLMLTGVTKSAPPSGTLATWTISDYTDPMWKTIIGL